MIQPKHLELIVQLAVSWALFGLIWTIQLSHYPGFHYVDPEQWHSFHTHHRQSITIIVMPLMLLELASAFWMVFHYGWSWAIPLLLVIAVWLLTFFVSVPLHGQLGNGKDTEVIQQLVTTNWPRTLLWTAKTLWVSWISWKIWT